MVPRVGGEGLDVGELFAEGQNFSTVEHIASFVKRDESAASLGVFFYFFPLQSCTNGIGKKQGIVLADAEAALIRKTKILDLAPGQCKSGFSASVDAGDAGGVNEEAVTSVFAHNR